MLGSPEITTKPLEVALFFTQAPASLRPAETGIPTAKVRVLTFTTASVPATSIVLTLRPFSISCQLLFFNRIPSKMRCASIDSLIKLTTSFLPPELLLTFSVFLSPLMEA